MKKTNLIFVLLSSAMLLAGCGGSSSSATPSSDPSSSEPSVDPSSEPSEDPSTEPEPVAPTAWTEEQLAAFTDDFGEALPFPTGVSADFEFVASEYDDGTPVIYCCDPNGTDDLVASYAAQLTDAGWVFNEDRTTVGINYTTYVYEKLFNPSRGDSHFYSVQVDKSSSGFEILADEYIYPAVYEGTTWNSEWVANAFTGYDDYVALPDYTAEGNANISFVEYDYHEYMGYPCFVADIYNTTLDEVTAWFTAIAEGFQLYSYVEMMGDDFETGDTACDNNNDCTTAIEGFVHHRYEMFFDDSFSYIMTVDNYLADEVPSIHIEYVYWGD